MIKKNLPQMKAITLIDFLIKKTRAHLIIGPEEEMEEQGDEFK
jgi:hypothetical protein